MRYAFWVFLMFVQTESAVAGFMFSFSQSQYTVQAGNTVEVSVSLTQDGVVDTILTDEGLASAGVRVLFEGALSTTDPAQVLSSFDVTPNTVLFDDLVFPPTIDLNPGFSAGLTESVDFFSPPALGNSILLGTFTFTAGLVSGEVTALRATVFDPVFSSTFSYDTLTELDPYISDGFAEILVVPASSPVPEPSTLMLALFAIGLMSVRGVFRRIQGCSFAFRLDH